ncbi:hypothetical protein SASPL_152771 [Salvia splendens]|uniref:Mechanosensitive channel protein 2/3 transmembrane domain-containing protein n=1 Tax=Salvia splendens TaxID=180675 RepID=A0A8X8W496_SALSN|nr:hypothetical protein SASPL_152771 [Salvia splendens]
MGVLLVSFVEHIKYKKMHGDLNILTLADDVDYLALEYACARKANQYNFKIKSLNGNPHVIKLASAVGAIYICRALDPMILPSEAGQIVKKRVLNFVRSLSTVLAVAYLFSSVFQQAQKFFMETNELTDASNVSGRSVMGMYHFASWQMGFQFVGRTVYTAVWVAAVSLFMELLGFSTQKWITAGGFGTVLITLAGREVCKSSKFSA